MSAISNTTLTYTATNITQTTYYRAVVNATSPSTCNGLATSSAAITVKPTLPGNITALKLFYMHWWPGGACPFWLSREYSKMANLNKQHYMD